MKENESLAEIFGFGGLGPWCQSSVMNARCNKVAYCEK